MSKADLVITWLKNCQLDDGSWTSGWDQGATCPLDEEQLQRHKLLYTSQVINALAGNDHDCDTELSKAHLFVKQEDGIEHPLYKIIFRILPYVTLGKYDDARPLITALISKIEPGGIVNYDYRIDSTHFDSCITLQAFIQSSQYLSVYSEIDKRIKNLIQHIAQSVVNGADPSYWLWRASLLSQTEIKFPTLNKKKIYLPAQLSIQTQLDAIKAIFSDRKWNMKKPHKATITPNLICDEVQTSHMLKNLTNLCTSKWIDFDDNVKEMIHDSTSFLLSQYEGMNFLSETIDIYGEKSQENDVYVTALIYDTLNIIYNSKLLKETIVGDELSGFFKEPIANQNDKQQSELIKILDEVPKEMITELPCELSSLLKKSPAIKAEAVISLGAPAILDLLVGFSAKMKFTIPMSRENLPTFHSWYKKLKHYAFKNIAQPRN